MAYHSLLHNYYWPFSAGNPEVVNADFVGYINHKGQWNIWFIPGTWVDED